MYYNLDKKILYCHGLGGEGLGAHQEVLRYFAQHGIDMVSPTIDHEHFINNPHIFELMKVLAQDVDYIVGNSMGGYFAYHLGKSLGKPTLLFNPAISKVTTSYSWFNRVTNYTPAEEQKDTLILLATHDDVVDHNHTRRFIESENYDTNRIESLEGMTHSLEFMTIINKMFEFTNTEKMTYVEED